MSIFKKKSSARESNEKKWVRKDPSLPLYMDVLPQERLSRILSFAEHLGFEKSFCDERGLLPVFSFIRMLSDRLCSERIIEVISKSTIGYENGTDFFLEYLFCRVEENNSDHCQKINETAHISLAYHPVLSNVWNSDRISYNFNSIGKVDNPFKYQEINHLAKLYMPFGLTTVYNGNHSIAAGILKKEGSIHIRKGSIFDLSPLYSKYRFDGVNYLDNSGKTAFKANSFEFGVIYEIGRIIRKEGVKFLDIDYF